MLQTLRMDIVGHQAKDPVVIVFVQTHIQNGDLPKIPYENAEERASQVVAMFREEFKIDASKITVLKN